MGLDGVSIFDRVLLRRTLRRWYRAARRGDAAALALLKRFISQARQLRRELDSFLDAADAQLAVVGAPAVIPRPDMADWAWRPDVWSGPVRPAGRAAAESGIAIGSDLKLFHDCPDSEVTFRQSPNAGSADLAPFALGLDVFRFDGSYLSLVIDLPEADVRDLRTRHILRLDARIEIERPVEIFVRLNIRHGPNTEQIVRELPRGQSEVFAEFDLAHSGMNEKRLERIWVDLIFDRPEMNRITLRDLTFSRRPRAEL